MSAAGLTARARPRGTVSLRGLENALLWLLIASSFFVFVEPAPYEFLFAATLPVFLAAGLCLKRELIVFTLLVVIFQLGGVIALVPYIHDPQAVSYVATSCYLGTTSIVFACLLGENTLERLTIIARAWIVAAVVVSCLGMAGYFDLGGTKDLFTQSGGRASGTFKDPNVFGPYLAAPAVLLIRGILVGDTRRPVLGMIALLVVMGGIFFSFSRGAWGVVLGGAVLCAVLTILTTDSSRIRRRVVGLGVLGVVVLALGLVALLSVESVRDVFTMRATLLQDYDTGAEGRFGEIVDMIRYLQTAPNGWGPMQHDKGFIHAPHNVFVNAFGAYGWTGGISFLALVAATFFVGWKTVFTRTPWQSLFVAYWSVAFLQLCQGIQIDLDRWRHVWLQLGLVWGVAAASQLYAMSRARAPRQI